MDNITAKEAIIKALQGCPEDALDGRVHEVASRLASDINNQGLEAQVEYLLAQGCEAGDLLSAGRGA